VATELSWRKSISPDPERTKLEVCSWDCFGKRKISEHCRPEYDEGMSKLKIDETVGVICPKYDVP
jgi:hypothetical protein